jgi:hypothetical protein
VKFKLGLARHAAQGIAKRMVANMIAEKTARPLSHCVHPTWAKPLLQFIGNAPNWPSSVAAGRSSQRNALFWTPDGSSGAHILTEASSLNGPQVARAS